MATARITTPYHVAVAFACPVETIWRDIVDGLGRGASFAARGYDIMPVADDPRARLGGYRMVRDSAGGRDERLCFLIGRDDEARRLDMVAHYLGAQARGTIVHATYTAEPVDDGCRYRIDCHATQDVEIPDGATSIEVAAIVDTLAMEGERGLRSALEARRAGLDAGGSSAGKKHDRTQPG